MEPVEPKVKCPFCPPENGDKLNVVEGMPGVMPSVVDCLNCGCSGPPKPTREGAVKAWDTRYPEETT